MSMKKAEVCGIEYPTKDVNSSDDSSACALSGVSYFISFWSIILPLLWIKYCNKSLLDDHTSMVSVINGTSHNTTSKV